MSRGKLIVIEGTDGSGKATQTSLLYGKLVSSGLSPMQLSFPRYGKPSAKLIEMYLGGVFGTDPKAFTSYETSKFYAIDRYISYKEEWESFYTSGGIILSDRYTTSNAVHQASKMGKEDRPHFFKWLYDLEFKHMGIPVPDLVIYLDMPLEVTEKLMRSRESVTNTKADIHERDTSYLSACKEAARDAVANYGWKHVSCAENGLPRSIEAIHEDIYKLVQDIL